MGRKWTNITFSVPGKTNQIPEASATPKTREEAIYEFTESEWDDDNVPPHDYGVTVSFGNIVSAYSDKPESYLRKYFTRFPWIEFAALVYVTDSANIGYGAIYDNVDGEPELVEEYDGYEGAFGEDVAGMISEDWSVTPTAEWYW